MWTNKDKVFFQILKMDSKPVKQEIERNSRKYHASSTKPDAIMFGYYSKYTRSFHWLNRMNHVLLDHARASYMDIFGTDETLKKLCKSVVKIEDHTIIPYLYEILDTTHSVIELDEVNGQIFYGATESVGSHFNFQKFSDHMFVYRMTQKAMVKKAKKTKKAKKAKTRKHHRAF